MRREMIGTLYIRADKIDVIYNGIRAEKKIHHKDIHDQDFRRRFDADDEKIV